MSSPVLLILLAAAALQTGASNLYHYSHWDVFTDDVLSGNQLAVFLEPEGLTSDLMMSITREMAFSETTFVFPPDVPGAAFRVRIFGNNLGREIEVAGHPTIGTVFALAAAGRIAPGTKEVVFQLGIGPTPLELTWEEDRLKFAWMRQRPPEFGGTLEDVAGLADALGVRPDDLDSPALPVQQVSCGAPFLIVPMRSRDAVDRSRMDREAMGSLLDASGLERRGIMIFTREPGGDDATVYSRMFGFGVVEDPATGNASGPLGAYLVRHRLVFGTSPYHIVSRQGVKMGRPSRVHIRVVIDEARSEITDVFVGGSSTLAGEGTLRVP